MKNIVFKWSETNRMKTDCCLKDERDFFFKGTMVSNLHLHHCNRIHCPILSGINLLMSWLPVMRWWTQWMMTDWKSGIAVSMPSSAIKIVCSLIVLWFRFFKLLFINSQCQSQQCKSWVWPKSRSLGLPIWTSFSCGVCSRSSLQHRHTVLALDRQIKKLCKGMVDAALRKWWDLGSEWVWWSSTWEDGT